MVPKAVAAREVDPLGGAGKAMAADGRAEQEIHPAVVAVTLRLAAGKNKPRTACW